MMCLDTPVRLGGLRRLAILILAGGLAGALGSACSMQAVPPLAAANGPSQDTLYASLGGEEGVELLTDNFLIELAADERVRSRFASTDIGRFHTMLQLHLCEVTDGPCDYTGDSMQRTHGGMDIQPVEFNAVVEALIRAMDQVGIELGVQNRLLQRLAPMQDQIVGQ